MWSLRSACMRTGHCTAGKGASCARATLLVAVGLAPLSLGGCSSVAPLPHSGLVGVFASAEPLRPRPAVDIEEDGREAQRPPAARMFQRKDDPTQPFSPNYGEVLLPRQPDQGGDKQPART